MDQRDARSHYYPRVIYAGVDEAGYGPLLGPLCIGASAFRVNDHRDIATPPDLWKLFDRAVCRKVKDSRRRIPISDSKKLKRVGEDPLIHLERGILAFCSENSLADDRALFDELGVHTRISAATPWHATALALPVSLSPFDVTIARNMVARAYAHSGASLAHLGVAALDAPAFNALYATLRNKALVNMSLIFDAVRTVDLLRGDEPAFIAVDRQGGRAQYAEELETHIARGAPVRTISESEDQSTYEIGEGLIISFEVGAEERHLPVALASMGAKYVRELFMRRLNAFFIGHMPTLAPTAGYVEDGRRFLAEVTTILAATEIPQRDFVRSV